MPQSTTSTLLPFEPGRFHHFPSGRQRAVLAPLRLEEIEGIGGTGVAEPDGRGEGSQAGEHVVVPVRREVDLQHHGVRGLARAVREHDAVLQEELGSRERLRPSLRTSRGRGSGPTSR